MMQPIQGDNSESQYVLDEWITNADAILVALEQDQTLGPAIRRFAFDFATVIGNLAREWEDAGENKQRLWARSCLEEARNQLALKDESADVDATLATLSEEEWVHHVSMAKTLLLDIEESLKSIGSDEADEIADVALVVLRIFLKTLKQFYNSDKNKATLNVEILDESSNDHHIGTVMDLSDNQINPKNKKTRFIWPPIGPSITSAAIWGQDIAIKQPILSIALAITLWPTAIVACFVGVPILATDWVLQSSYDKFQHHPVMENLEMGASNLLDIAKFYFLCSKLVIKQGIRVGKRQINRRGGLENTLKDIGSWTLSRVLHPVETVTMGSKAVMQGFGAVQGLVQKKNRNSGVYESNVDFHDCT